MINVYESTTLTERYPSGPFGVMSFGDDREEWQGVRSQLLAIIYGWAEGMSE